ncbi:hypothetical protein AURDEDRAFT_160203 [Auricularia subglabra TFB-10046 SS5]|nr:hypothetical protein AURDEDRAFT_160203 [Auricularia subglabra TFB-10046 SS5]
MSVPLPNPQAAFASGQPLADLNVAQLRELATLLGLTTSKEKKQLLREKCDAELKSCEATYIKDPRFSHFYQFKDGHDANPRKNSADKALEDATQGAVEKGPTPALQKLITAGIPLNPPGHTVAKGLLGLDYGSDEDDTDGGRPPSSTGDDDEQISPTEERLAVTKSKAGSNAANRISPAAPAHDDDYSGGFNSWLGDPDLYPSPPRRAVNVQIHLPGRAPDEVTVELDDEVSDLPIGLTDDISASKSARLSDIIPKVLDVHTPLKSASNLSDPVHTPNIFSDATGALKTTGRARGSYKYLGGMDKIRENNFSKFKLAAADTQPLEERHGQYSISLWVEPETGYMPQGVQMQHAVAPIDSAGAMNIAHNIVPPALPAQPAGSTQPVSQAQALPPTDPPAGTKLDGDSAFMEWLRSELGTKFKVQLYSEPVDGDLVGQIVIRIRAYNNIVNVLKPWYTRRSAYTVPVSSSRYAGCKFTQATIFKILLIGKTQMGHDVPLFTKADQRAHKLFISWRDDPNSTITKFNDITRDQLVEWKKKQLKKAKNSSGAREVRPSQSSSRARTPRTKDTAPVTKAKRPAAVKEKAVSQSRRTPRTASPEFEEHSSTDESADNDISDEEEEDEVDQGSQEEYDDVEEDDEQAPSPQIFVHRGKRYIEVDDLQTSPNDRPKKKKKKHAGKRLTSEGLDDSG